MLDRFLSIFLFLVSESLWKRVSLWNALRPSTILSAPIRFPRSPSAFQWDKSNLRQPLFIGFLSLTYTHACSKSLHVIWIVLIIWWNGEHAWAHYSKWCPTRALHGRTKISAFRIDSARHILKSSLSSECKPSAFSRYLSCPNQRVKHAEPFPTLSYLSWAHYSKYRPTNARNSDRRTSGFQDPTVGMRHHALPFAFWHRTLRLGFGPINTPSYLACYVWSFMTWCPSGSVGKRE